MYSAHGYESERFLSFLRSLGSKAMLLTAFSIVLVTLAGDVDVTLRLVLAMVLIFTAIGLAAIANIVKFGSSALSDYLWSEARKFPYFLSQ